MKGNPSMGQAHDPPMNNGRRPPIIVALVAAVPSLEPVPISTTVRSTTTIIEP